MAVSRSIRALCAGAVLAVSSIASAATDIVDTAVSAGSFKTLVAAVQAAGLVDTLSGGRLDVGADQPGDSMDGGHGRDESRCVFRKSRVRGAGRHG